MSNSYQQELLRLKLYGKQVEQKKRYTIPKVSKKRAAKEAKEKEERAGEDSQLQKWFLNRRREMTGKCACGCGRKSSKLDDVNFRSSICHIFPQAKFESVKCLKMNWVERSFWDGCHSNLDNKGMDEWPKMADWQDIVEKFHVLAPLLTDEERATKFYNHLEKLVYGKL